MKLTDLAARFVRHAVEPAPHYHGKKLPDGSTQWGGFDIDVFHVVPTLAEADGIVFLCPKSYAKNNGPVGTHSVRVYFEGSAVPTRIGQNSAGQPVRWKATGTGLDDLTLTPSILEQDGICEWHGFVTNGDAA